MQRVACCVPPPMLPPRAPFPCPQCMQRLHRPHSQLVQWLWHGRALTGIGDRGPCAVMHLRERSCEAMPQTGPPAPCPRRVPLASIPPSPRRASGCKLVGTAAAYEHRTMSIQTPLTRMVQGDIRMWPLWVSISAGQQWTQGNHQHHAAVSPMFKLKCVEANHQRIQPGVCMPWGPLADLLESAPQ